MQNLHSENYITMPRETKEDLNEWRDIPCPQNRKFNNINVSNPRKLSTNSRQFQSKSQKVICEKW